MFRRLPVIKFLNKNKKTIFRATILSALGMGYYTYKQILKKNAGVIQVYDQFRERIQWRTTHHSIQSLFPSSQIQYMFSPSVVPKQFKSIEITTELDANNFGAPLITNENDSKSELPGLSILPWREFVESASDTIYITFSNRKAFSKNSPFPFTHANLYLRDSEQNHGLFGYNANKNNYIINDYTNGTVSRLSTVYSDLTILGNRQQVIALFEKIERYAAQQRYTAISCNCYSPLIMGLLDAKRIGFKVPDDFNDSLLIVIPAEQNYGMGITSNQFLRPLSENAVLRAHRIFNKWQKKAEDKLDEIKDVMKFKKNN